MTVIQNNTDLIIAICAICALLTSVVSIIFTKRALNTQERHTKQALETQKQHNLKSVKPIGFITEGDHENDIYVRVANNGVGPLIIKEFKIIKKSQIIMEFKASNYPDLNKILPDNLKNVIWTNCVVDIIGRALKPGDQFYLLRKKISEEELQQGNNEQIKNDLRDFLRQLTLEMTYTDIYENPEEPLSKELKFFGRHFEGENVAKIQR